MIPNMSELLVLQSKYDAKQKAKERDADEIMIIGGGYIYNEFI